MALVVGVRRSPTPAFAVSGSSVGPDLVAKARRGGKVRTAVGWGNDLLWLGLSLDASPLPHRVTLLDQWLEIKDRPKNPMVYPEPRFAGSGKLQRFRFTVRVAVVVANRGGTAIRSFWGVTPPSIAFRPCVRESSSRNVTSRDQWHEFSMVLSYCPPSDKLCEWGIESHRLDPPRDWTDEISRHAALVCAIASAVPDDSKVGGILSTPAGGPTP